MESQRLAEEGQAAPACRSQAANWLWKSSGSVNVLAGRTLVSR